MACNDPVVQRQLEKLVLMLDAIADAILALLATNGVKSYSLDTGQGRQTVTREDVANLQETYERIFWQYDALNQRCNGTPATLQVTPSRVVPWIW